MTDATVSLPTLRYANESTVAPGDRLGTLRQVSPGAGTYVKGGQIYASVAGKLYVHHEPPQQQQQQQQQGSYIATVKLPENKCLASTQVLSVDQIVLCRVVRISTQQATMEIVAVEGVGSLRQTHEGAVRREDIRKGASELVQIKDSFLPGDLVLCRILALGDTRRYLLTTAEPELGVIHAISATTGKPMVPKSWKEMQCAESGATEPRKCARPRTVLS